MPLRMYSRIADPFVPGSCIFIIDDLVFGEGIIVERGHDKRDGIHSQNRNLRAKGAVIA